MIRIDPFWWRPESKFFGLFYQIGDFSRFGYSSTMRLSNKQRTIREVNFIINLLSLKKGATILDCPCGYGRHSIELAKRGFKVTGVDINNYFLSQCIKKVKNLSKLINCKFLEQSMLELNLRENSYESIINIFTSFGFFESDDDNRKVLENFYSALITGGKLLLHFDFNSHRIITKKYFKGDEYKHRECIFNKIKYDLFVNEYYDRESKRLNGSWNLRNGDLPEPIEMFYSIRIYKNIEITKILYSIGFKKVEFYDPSNDEFNDESKETIIIATK